MVRELYALSVDAHIPDDCVFWRVNGVARNVWENAVVGICCIVIDANRRIGFCVGLDVPVLVAVVVR